MGASGVSSASSVSSAPCVLNVFNALTALDVSSVLGVLSALENEIAKSKVRRKPMQIIGFQGKYKHTCNSRSRLRCPEFKLGIPTPTSGHRRRRIKTIQTNTRRPTDRPDVNNKNDDTNRIKVKIPNRPLDTETVKAKSFKATSGHRGRAENATARSERTKPR